MSWILFALMFLPNGTIERVDLGTFGTPKACVAHMRIEAERLIKLNPDDETTELYCLKVATVV